MNIAPNRLARVLAACGITIVFAVGTAQAQEQPCLTVSKFGPEDQIGNLNYVTPEKTLAAAKLVTRGKAYRLGIEKVPPVATRGVLLDMAGYFNIDIVKEVTLGPSRITGGVQAIINPIAIK